MKRILMATTVALLMVGCGDSAPECAESDVKDLVIQIAQGEVLKGRLDSNGNLTSGISKFPLDEDRDTDIQIMKEDHIKYGYGEISDVVLENQLRYLAESRQAYKNLKEVADNLQLDAIRTDSTDENTKKTTCKAQLKMFGNARTRTLNLTYTVQMTEDGELFAEVYGL